METEIPQNGCDVELRQAVNSISSTHGATLNVKINPTPEQCKNDAIDILQNLYAGCNSWNPEVREHLKSARTAIGKALKRLL